MADLVGRNRALFIFGALFILFVFASSIYPSWFPEWTGLPERPRDDAVYPAKTLWDWLDLFLIPFFLAAAAFLLNRAENERNRVREIQEQQRKNLDTYIAQMTNLLLSPHPYDRSGLQVARTLTLTALQNIDEESKRVVLQFLYEAGFLWQDDFSILRGVDLGGTKLRGINLLGANLRGLKLSNSDLEGSDISLANLQGAKLENIILNNSDLIETNMQGAHLTGANLRSANLSWANLQDSFCTGANFQKADLSNADFTGADLSGAKTGEAITSGTIFTDAAGVNTPPDINST